jgi:sugar lactone lactonase YvrE
VDSAGNLYVTDGAIRKVTPDGVVTTLGVMLHFQPGAVAVDSASNLYVTDVANDIIDKITPEGLVTALAGTEGVAGSADGIGATASFNGPSGVAVDSAGDLYVADHDNHTIRVVTPTGNVTTLAGAVAMAGSADGLGVTARFNTPVGMAVDSTGNLYVADSNNATIREITPAGFVTTLAGAAGMVGNVDGTGAEARFFSPTAVAVDSTNNLYVTDGSNDSIRKVTPEGVVTTLAGAADMVGSADGTGAAARFSNPYGMAMDSAGNLYVADSGNNAIRMVTPDGVVTTLAGGMVGSTDGTGAAARFYGPGSMAMDTAGNLYVADYGNHTIRKVTPTGIVTTLAGAGIAGYVDGTGAAAQFRGPSDLAVDSSGNLYVADDSAIRKITPTGVTTTVAGAPGEIGIKLGAMPRFASPVGLAIAGDALIVSDTNAILLLRNVVR